MNNHQTTAPQPQSIVISHVYSSDNKGDAALTSVLISDLKRRFPEATIRILKLELSDGTTDFEGVTEQPAFMHYALNKYRHPLPKLAYVVYLVPATLAWAAWLRRTGRRLPLPKDLRQVADTYAAADLVVAVGGGYIRSRQGLANRLNIPLLLHPLLFGHLLRLPTVLYSQSVGPFVHASERPLVAFVLRRMTLILLREDTSAKLLASLGVTRNVRRAIDSGFLLASPARVNLRQLYHIPAGKLLVGVTVRSWLKGAAQANYEAAVARALDNLVETAAAHAVFIPQVTAAKGDDDRLVSRRVHSLMHRPEAATLIQDAPDHHRIKALYDNLDILLGTRFHSVIFSLTSYVPVVAIEYEHKTSGIMRDLELQDWVVSIEDVTAPRLTELLNRLVQQQEPYRAHLRQHLPPYVERARQSVELLADSYAAAEPRPVPSSQSSK